LFTIANNLQWKSQIATNLERARIEAKSGNLSPAFSKFLNEVFDSSKYRINNVLNSLKNGEVNDDINRMLFYRMSAVHPTNEFEVPAAVSQAKGFSRAFFNFKIYTIRQFNYVRKESIAKLASKDPIEKRAGLTGLIMLPALLISAGATKQQVYNFMRGKKDESWWDSAVGSALQLLPVFNRYTIEQLGRGDVKGVIGSQIPLPQTPVRAVQDFRKGEVKQSLRSIPMVGDVVYNKTYPKITGPQRPKRPTRPKRKD
jgi:hypothetical protein